MGAEDTGTPVKALFSIIASNVQTRASYKPERDELFREVPRKKRAN